jgi:dihydroorotate dehydrogenase
MAPFADFLTVNISSPNTPGLRGLQDEEALAELLDAVAEARAGAAPPVFLKVAPDLSTREIEAVARVAMERRVDALIVGNTTLSRPPLRSKHSGEAGGLSGAPLKDLALQRLKDFRAATGGALPLIAVGGIENGVDAYARIRAGASLVQLYTALVYQGPGVAVSILSELRTLLSRDGFATLVEAVG